MEEENGDAVREAKVLHASILCNGDETQKSWKPLLNTIFALSGSSEWFVQLEACRTFASLTAVHWLVAQT